MAYICPHRQRHRRVSQPRVSPRAPYNFKSALSTAKAHGRVASCVT
ncbi:Indole-3-glycerol phosphate synthase [Gossypium arboreum]|uniref:Indole-3-glycerol phosphate synthase n=1 Tax=Gossypium arboreum TaxID=29729 RepID=A0A0B0P0W6_GOSAR|nr:Indole-3-glycerol phosphate synthase [Gossypium arboreum]